MGMIHVLNADGTCTPWEERQVVEMLGTGQLSPQTYFWKEGMAEWRPLSDLTVPPPPPVFTSLAPSVPRRYHLTKDPGTLALIVKILLAISVVVAILNFGCGVAIQYHTAIRDFKAVQFDAHLMTVAGYLSVAVYVITAVPFLMWIYRANFNCRGFAAGMKYSPGLAAGSFFIPFANLIYPCAAMQEIWKVCQNPDEWQMESGSVLVGFWWGFWLWCNVLGQVLMHYPKTQAGDTLPTIISTLQNISTILIVLELSKIVLSGLAFAMIHRITRRQYALTSLS